MKDLEERLENLDEMRNMGLLSYEEYVLKRERVTNEIYRRIYAVIENEKEPD